MFGYIQANVRELKIREYETYRGYYCGLCHTLKQRYGRDGQMLLSYDMTFLLMLLTALYEPAQTQERRRCLPHPVRRHLMITNDISGYAADMTVMLSYQKAADDWTDERSLKGKALSLLLQRDYRKLARTYPRQAAELERCVKALGEAERSGCADIDYVAGLTGRFLGEMFVREEDIWQEQLRRTGFYLGKFVYLMDAWDDREKDAKSGAYNLLNRDPSLAERAMEIMQDTMACCCRAFEQLPILEMGEILRNILYAGVWTSCARKSAAQTPPRS